MSDLISRSALLQKFNDSGIQITFDLPVEEILGEDVDIDDFAMLVQDAIQAYKNMVIGTINDMPTAYNVEKVVAEMERIKNDASQGCDEVSYDKCNTYKNCANCILDRTICIVKAGGVE